MNVCSKIVPYACVFKEYPYYVFKDRPLMHVSSKIVPYAYVFKDYPLLSLQRSPP